MPSSSLLNKRSVFSTMLRLNAKALLGNTTRGDDLRVTFNTSDRRLGRIEIPDLRDAQQARVGIGLRQLRNQLLVAVLGQLPAPVEGALVTETDLPARGLFHKTRIFADEDLEQGLVALATERIPGT